MALQAQKVSGSFEKQLAMGALSHRHNRLVAHPKGSERGGFLLTAW